MLPKMQRGFQRRSTSISASARMLSAFLFLEMLTMLASASHVSGSSSRKSSTDGTPRNANLLHVQLPTAAESGPGAAAPAATAAAAGTAVRASAPVVEREDDFFDDAGTIDEPPSPTEVLQRTVSEDRSSLLRRSRSSGAASGSASSFAEISGSCSSWCGEPPRVAEADRTGSGSSHSLSQADQDASSFRYPYSKEEEEKVIAELHSLVRGLKGLNLGGNCNQEVAPSAVPTVEYTEEYWKLVREMEEEKAAAAEDEDKTRLIQWIRDRGLGVEYEDLYRRQPLAGGLRLPTGAPRALEPPRMPAMGVSTMHAERRLPELTVEEAARDVESAPTVLSPSPELQLPGVKARSPELMTWSAADPKVLVEHGGPGRKAADNSPFSQLEELSSSPHFDLRVTTAGGQKNWSQCSLTSLLGTANGSGSQQTLSPRSDGAVTSPSASAAERHTSEASAVRSRRKEYFCTPVVAGDNTHTTNASSSCRAASGSSISSFGIGSGRTSWDSWGTGEWSCGNPTGEVGGGGTTCGKKKPAASPSSGTSNCSATHQSQQAATCFPADSGGAAASLEPNCARRSQEALAPALLAASAAAEEQSVRATAMVSSTTTDSPCLSPTMSCSNGGDDGGDSTGHQHHAQASCSQHAASAVADEPEAKSRKEPASDSFRQFVQDVMKLTEQGAEGSDPSRTCSTASTCTPTGTTRASAKAKRKDVESSASSDEEEEEGLAESYLGVGGMKMKKAGVPLLQRRCAGILVPAGLAAAALLDHLAPSAGSGHRREQSLVVPVREEPGFTVCSPSWAVTDENCAVENWDEATMPAPANAATTETDEHEDDSMNVMPTMDPPTRWSGRQTAPLVLTAALGAAGTARYFGH